MYRKIIFLGFTVLYLLVALLVPSTVLAEDKNTLSRKYNAELTSIRNALLRNPRAIQAELQAMYSSVIQSDKELELLWLLRMAESCNLSYQYDCFETYVSEAVNLVKPSHSTRLRAWTEFYQSIVYRRKGDFGQAAKLAKHAIQMAGQIRDVLLEVEALVDLAYTYSQDEQFESSLLTLQQGFVVANEQNDPLMLGQLHEMYGALYGYLEKPEESIENYRKSQRIYEQLGYPYYIAENAFGMATTYRDWQKWDDAIQWFETYNRAVVSIDSAYTRFFYGYGLGMTYALKGDCQRSLEAIEPALQIDAFPDYRAELLKKKALCLAKAGQFLPAEKALDEARIIFNSMPDLSGTSWQIETDKIAAQLAAMKGDHAIAYQTLQKYYDDLQQVQKINTSRRLEKLKLDLEKEREMLELKVLEKQSQVQLLTMNNQERQIELQRVWLYGSISLILVILIFVGWQFHVSRKFKSLAITDELTGLSNRRYIFSAIERILQNASSKQFHHSLLLIDVDNLKPVNDRYGHLYGDKVLKEVAKVGRSVSRDSDIFARIGGDEFMLLLMRTDRELEDNIVGRLIDSLAKAQVMTDTGERLVITVSIGVVSLDENVSSPERLYTQVDEALYRAKLAGRNGYSR